LLEAGYQGICKDIITIGHLTKTDDLILEFSAR